jgi:hypothetical protein
MAPFPETLGDLDWDLDWVSKSRLFLCREWLKSVRISPSWRHIKSAYDVHDASSKNKLIKKVVDAWLAAIRPCSRPPGDSGCWLHLSRHIYLSCSASSPGSCGSSSSSEETRINGHFFWKNQQAKSNTGLQRFTSRKAITIIGIDTVNTSQSIATSREK